MTRRAAPAGAGPPRPRRALGEHPVELAHVPERERAQERPQRRGRSDPAAQQTARAARTEHAHSHRCSRRRAPSRRSSSSPSARSRPWPLRPQQHEPVDQTFDPQPLRERRHQRDPGIRDDPLVIKNDPHPVQSDRPVIMHQQGDLLCRAPAAHTAWKNPAQEVILASPPDRTHPPPRWIKAEYACFRVQPRSR